MLRLTTLDSLYSTNASKSYYAIEEMAGAIWNIGNREDLANSFFNDVAQNKKIDDDWFNNKFGIQKNGKTGHRMTSLLSKYAYYCLLLDPNSDGFPIYDSLAVSSFPFAFNILWPKITRNNNDNLKKLVRAFSSDPSSQKDIPISLYIKAMNTLCNGLDLQNNPISGFQKFDILDAYLWRMGKLSNGNLSLLLDKQGYMILMKELSLMVDPSDEKDAEYFRRIAESPKSPFNNCVDEKISQKNPCSLNTYPSILANKICDKFLISKDPEKGTYTGNVNALVLHSLMTNPKIQLKHFSKRNKQYFNDIFRHWQDYYNQ